jgi:transposase
MSDNIIQLNQELIHNELKNLVRNSVEETLNALLDHEAEELVNAEKYERSGDRKGYRSGHYSRNFQTTAGEVSSLQIEELGGYLTGLKNDLQAIKNCVDYKYSNGLAEGSVNAKILLNEYYYQIN